jgi:hypothetical protein
MMPRTPNTAPTKSPPVDDHYDYDSPENVGPGRLLVASKSSSKSSNTLKEMANRIKTRICSQRAANTSSGGASPKTSSQTSYLSSRRGPSSTQLKEAKSSRKDIVKSALHAAIKNDLSTTLVDPASSFSSLSPPPNQQQHLQLHQQESDTSITYENSCRFHDSWGSLEMDIYCEEGTATRMPARHVAKKLQSLEASTNSKSKTRRNGLANACEGKNAPKTTTRNKRTSSKNSAPGSKATNATGRNKMSSSPSSSNSSGTTRRKSERRNSTTAMQPSSGSSSTINNRKPERRMSTTCIPTNNERSWLPTTDVILDEGVKKASSTSSGSSGGTGTRRKKAERRYSTTAMQPSISSGAIKNRKPARRMSTSTTCIPHNNESSWLPRTADDLLVEEEDCLYIDVADPPPSSWAMLGLALQDPAEISRPSRRRRISAVTSTTY